MDNYDKEIKRIREINDFEEKMKQLEQVYQNKPVRLMWYVAKAEALVDRDVGACLQTLGNKYITDFLYEGVRESEKIHHKISTVGGDIPLIRYREYMLACLEGNTEICTSFENSIAESESIIMENWGQIQLELLSDWYLSSENWFSYLVLRLYVDYKYKVNSFKRDWVINIPNMGYLTECLNQQSKVIICIDSLQKEMEAYILGRCFAEMGCTTCVLSIPEGIEVDVPVNPKETLAISLDNISGVYGFDFIPVIDVIYDGQSMGTNCEYIIESLCGESETFLFIASSNKYAELTCESVLDKKIDMLLGYKDNFRAGNYTFGWCGSYLGYMNQLYHIETKSMIEKKAECRFSIIIPARNSATTLRYTLQTCLKQTYNGSYEIIVSDNSTGNNASVYNLCKEMNDPRIVYLKTPRDLHLPKSFEYAYLHANGEYIFAIGSDDGVLPWALERLDKVVTQYPEEEIIQWERGFYAWPGFNGGQQHQFIIPGKYDKNDFGLFYREKREYLASVFKDSANMYILPMLYINSCFKRCYFQTLLDKTGRLWDGICQDIYMGVVTACINLRILNMRYPLTIAGMSSGSVGANANLGTKTNEEFEKLMSEVLQDFNLGGYSPSYYEKLIPQLGTDTTSLYVSLLRAISFGILPKEYLEAFDWKRIFLQLAAELDIRDVAYDCKIHQMQYAASFHGEEFLEWFNEAIYEPGLTPRVIDEEKIKTNAAKRKYSVGEAENGSLTLDASEYGVQNVYDAVQLFKRLMPL